MTNQTRLLKILYVAMDTYNNADLVNKYGSLLSDKVSLSGIFINSFPDKILGAIKTFKRNTNPKPNSKAGFSAYVY